MSKRVTFSDKIVFSEEWSLTPSGTLNATVRATSFDTANALSIGILIDIVTKTSSKAIGFGFEESDDNSNWNAVDMLYTDLNVNQRITANGNYGGAYWGDKRYIRFRVVSQTSGGTGLLRGYYYNVILNSVPGNLAVV